jgi:glycerol-3-phosphate dehydrogenase
MPDGRETAWASLSQPWDVIVIGGGITGAGILHEAAATGLRALLLEMRDFSFGASSRSGKFVHGGIRYLRNRQFGVTYFSVRERENLIQKMPGLVTRQMLDYLWLDSDRSSPWRLGADLMIYELFAGRRAVQRVTAAQLSQRAIWLGTSRVRGAYRYAEGLTDDSRLVLRVLSEAEKLGGVALNYARVISLLQQQNGKVVGVAVRDECAEGAGRTVEVRASVVINATGYHSDGLRAKLGGPPRIRMSRGSHLIFPLERFPVSEAICYYHPDDQRIQFVVPWQGVLMVGTTDLDYDMAEEQEFGEPRIRPEEAEYILAGLKHSFPDAHFALEHVQSTFCGVRPLVYGGRTNPSRESRQHAIWDEKGMITVTGGKLTTYRLMAHSALHMASKHLPNDRRVELAIPEWPEPDPETAQQIDPSIRLWLVGRYGSAAVDVTKCALPGELERIGYTPILWAEVRWAARHGNLIHLDDLMLRHTHLGLALPRGGLPMMEQIRSIASTELKWNESRWDREIAAYQRLWQACYFLPN